jgi:hypothetical protein
VFSNVFPSLNLGRIKVLAGNSRGAFCGAMAASFLLVKDVF